MEGTALNGQRLWRLEHWRMEMEEGAGWSVWRHVWCHWIGFRWSWASWLGWFGRRRGWSKILNAAKGISRVWKRILLDKKIDTGGKKHLPSVSLGLNKKNVT